HMNRYREIAVALVRYGFGFIVEETELLHALSLPARIFRVQQKERRRSTVGERLHDVIQELGPTFVKLGQLASTRADLLPQEVVDELAKLQDTVAPFPYETVRGILTAEYG